ncbi:MAG: zf-TFIIB domain-containing protein [Thermoplasmata archaeon]|nr:MAG: zf-TFIIB domain-containing protein [Thermoplasmata archaeon]
MSIKKKIMQKKIDCPRCWVEARREEVEIFGPNIEIDICPKCNGIWLDPGELGKLLKNKKLTDYLTKQIGTQSKSELVCPRCGGLMDIESAEEVQIDVCLNCHGVWLDEGELDDLKGKSKEGFRGDDIEKAQEKWEELAKKQREQNLRRFRRRFI